MIRATNLVKNYGSFAAVKDISFEVCTRGANFREHPAGGNSLSAPAVRASIGHFRRREYSA